MPNLPQTFDLPRNEPSWADLARVWMRQWTGMTQVVNAALKVDTIANRPATPQFNETLFYASDTDQLYIAVDGVWIPYP